MADSQLMCMEDGHIGVNVPETRPEFYYSEEQRAAIEELLKNGDGAFKMRLKDDNMKDFLSARELKLLLSTFRKYDSDGDSRARPAGAQQQQQEKAKGEGAAARADADSGVHSTYWPQMSDTEVPPLDIGWPTGAMFKGVTRVAVHTHPPKDNGPHIKEVVRRLIQEASKVIAIVMDLLTDVQILQDLMDAAWRRGVPIYILLDQQGVPHFLDMCSRLKIGIHHLRNIRARTLEGVGFGLSFGRLPGAVCNRYMLVDGDKVMFGSYSFSWCTSRMDRNMITVMTGQVVDFFDMDFRELYAISSKLNLYKEFHLDLPAPRKDDAARFRAGSKRPPLPATTSRFQVTLGDSKKTGIQIPAHKLYNPKYELAFGSAKRPTGSLQEPGHKRVLAIAELMRESEAGAGRLASSEKVDRLSPHPAEAPSDIFKKPGKLRLSKKAAFPWKPKIFRSKSSAKPPAEGGPEPPPPPSPPPPSTETSQVGDNEDNYEVAVVTPPKPGRKLLRVSKRALSEQAINTEKDSEGGKSQPTEKQQCKIS